MILSREGYWSLTALKPSVHEVLSDSWVDWLEFFKLVKTKELCYWTSGKHWEDEVALLCNLGNIINQKQGNKIASLLVSCVGECGIWTLAWAKHEPKTEKEKRWHDILTRVWWPQHKIMKQKRNRSKTNKNKHEFISM